MSKPVCLVTAPVGTRSGYGAHARDIVRALIKLDKYDIKIWSVKWGSTPLNALEKGNPNDDMIIERLLMEPSLPQQPEIHIHIVIPNEFQTFGKYNIGITAGLSRGVFLLSRLSNQKFVRGRAITLIFFSAIFPPKFEISL